MDEGPAERLLSAARLAHDEGRPLDIPASTVLRIAGDEAETIRFRRLAREINDPELRDLIYAYLQNLQKFEVRRSRSADLWAENIKLGVGGVGSVTVLTGIVGIGAAAGATGGLFLVACGIAGIALAVGGNTFFRWRGNKGRNSAEDISVLLGALDG
ncbi:MAG: hypothetical protein JOZ90_12400 [Alphaproteobacteria bacterium]|nr:hypothetical protein [Alphaproteobacteria bacterium]MBV9372123.1 hypothetical protein [Alphaproteobacteria bacterium]MBV9901875.1 hypothetical protein [Alphaproteobacteria bacterium]